MLTREEIMAKLEENMDWEPPMEASDEEWDLYEEMRQEMLKKKGLPKEDEEEFGEYDDGFDTEEEEY